MIGGALTLDTLAALSGRDVHRPLDRDAMRVAVYELAARGLTPADISQALSLSIGAVGDLLGERAAA